MRRSPGTRRSAGPFEQPLIMRLITTASLALLLLFAFAVTAHGDAGETGAAPSLAAESVDSFDDTAAGDQAQTLTASPAAGTSALAGVALCVLGVLCGLAAVLLLSHVLRRPGPLAALRERLRALPAAPASAAHSLATATSLIRLGVSRT